MDLSTLPHLYLEQVHVVDVPAVLSHASIAEQGIVRGHLLHPGNNHDRVGTVGGRDGAQPWPRIT